MNTQVSLINIGTVGLGVMCLGILISAAPLPAQEKKDKLEVRQPEENELLASNAWRSLDAKEYEAATRLADKCITKFHGDAERTQDALKTKNEPPPPVGNVKDEVEREKIFDRGTLNDVATCYFIKGESFTAQAEGVSGAGKQDRLAKAKAAYEAAAKYTYARCYSPKSKSFWDTAATANDRLAEMKPIR
jgi:hypothetical protein